MRLKDETLAGKLDSGISVRSDFKVAPGTLCDSAGACAMPKVR